MSWFMSMIVDGWETMVFIGVDAAIIKKFAPILVPDMQRQRALSTPTSSVSSATLPTATPKDLSNNTPYMEAAMSIPLYFITNLISACTRKRVVSIKMMPEAMPGNGACNHKLRATSFGRIEE